MLTVAREDCKMSTHWICDKPCFFVLGNKLQNTKRVPHRIQIKPQGGNIMAGQIRMTPETMRTRS